MPDQGPCQGKYRVRHELRDLARFCLLITIGLYSSSSRNEKFHSSSQFWNGTEKKIPFSRRTGTAVQTFFWNCNQFSSRNGTELRNCSSKSSSGVPICSAESLNLPCILSQSTVNYVFLHKVPTSSATF